MDKMTRTISLRHAIAIKIYDYHFPMGPGGAGRIAQRVLRALGLMVTEDGVMRYRTIRAINAAKLLSKK